MFGGSCRGHLRYNFNTNNAIFPWHEKPLSVQYVNGPSQSELLTCHAMCSFSFDFDDIMAVNVVRNSNVIRAVNAQLPFRDKSIYEAATNTPGAVQRAIDSALLGSTVTAVLNGPATAESNWVRYEIAKSFERGNGFLVIDINGVAPRLLEVIHC